MSAEQVARIRRRAGTYVGNLDGNGILNLVLELVANALDQHLAGHCSALAVDIEEDGWITVADDGPGFDPALVERALAEQSHAPTVDGHRPHAHLGLGGAGLFVVSALSERLELRSVRAGIATQLVHARGVPLDPVATAPASARAGTTIRFRADREIFGSSVVPRERLLEKLEHLASLVPGLAVSYLGRELAVRGLAARVAVLAGCSVDAVMSHRATHETPCGAVDVDVALAWRPGGDGPLIESFVNFRATIEHGAHVDGLLDAVAGRRRGLVAVVSVIASDVKYGNPTRDLVISEHLRGAVAATVIETISS